MARYSDKSKGNLGRCRNCEGGALTQGLMADYNIKSKGKSLSGHFSPAEAVDLLETAASRGRSISEILTRAVAVGLPVVKKRFPPMADDHRSRPGQLHLVHTITPQLAELMKKWRVLKKGKTLSGHFIPEQAIEVLETARARGFSTGSIVKAAVRIGLPEVKKMLPPTQTS